MALVSGTNAEADALNDAIQQRRRDAGELDARIVAWGMEEQRILVGDTVQTRRNDARTGVGNRAQWVVRAIRDDSVDLVAVSDSGARLQTMRASTCSSRTRRRFTQFRVRRRMPRSSGKHAGQSSESGEQMKLLWSELG